MKACAADCVIDGTAAAPRWCCAAAPSPVIDPLVAQVLVAPIRCGRTKLVCVDGPSGGGKTQLAAASGGSGR